MSVHTPCQVCGMCEYGYGCEDEPVEKRNPLCFYRLMNLEDDLTDHGIGDRDTDTVLDVVQKWLRCAPAD